MYVWSAVWSIENLAQWGNPARTDISLPVCKIILNLSINEKSCVIGFMLSLGCCACVRHFVSLIWFPKFPSHTLSCLLHFHSVYTMAKAFIHMLFRSKFKQKRISSLLRLYTKQKPVIKIFKDSLI